MELGRGVPDGGERRTVQAVENGEKDVVGEILKVNEAGCVCGGHRWERSFRWWLVVVWSLLLASLFEMNVL